MGNTFLAFLVGFSGLAVFAESGDQIGAAPRALFDETDKLGQPVDDFLGRGMFNLAGAFLGNLFPHRQDLDEKILEHPMAENNILGHFLAGRGEGDHLIGGIIDQPLLGQGAKGLGHRGTADLERAGNLLGSGHLFFRDDVEDGLQIVFQAGAESFGSRHGLSSCPLCADRESKGVQCQASCRIASFRLCTNNLRMN